jgi:hypothetical protein
VVFFLRMSAQKGMDQHRRSRSDEAKTPDAKGAEAILEALKNKRGGHFRLGVNVGNCTF